MGKAGEDSASGTPRRLKRRVAPQSPWQNQLVEQLIGTLRREYLDQVIVLNEAT